MILKITHYNLGNINTCLQDDETNYTMSTGNNSFTNNTPDLDNDLNLENCVNGNHNSLDDGQVSTTSIYSENYKLASLPPPCSNMHKCMYHAIDTSISSLKNKNA